MNLDQLNPIRLNTGTGLLQSFAVSALSTGAAKLYPPAESATALPGAVSQPATVNPLEQPVRQTLEILKVVLAGMLQILKLLLDSRAETKGPLASGSDTGNPAKGGAVADDKAAGSTTEKSGLDELFSKADAALNVPVADSTAAPAPASETSGAPLAVPQESADSSAAGGAISSAARVQVLDTLLSMLGQILQIVNDKLSGPGNGAAQTDCAGSASGHEVTYQRRCGGFLKRLIQGGKKLGEELLKGALIFASNWLGNPAGRAVLK